MPEDYRGKTALRRQLALCKALTVPDKIIDMDLTQDLKTYIRSSGADLTGIADLEPKARPGIGALICGVCVKVCSFGRKESSQKRGAAVRGFKDKDALIL